MVMMRIKRWTRSRTTPSSRDANEVVFSRATKETRHRTSRIQDSLLQRAMLSFEFLHLTGYSSTSSVLVNSTSQFGNADRSALAPAGVTWFRATFTYSNVVTVLRCMSPASVIFPPP
jgi:hypothetical protein